MPGQSQQLLNFGSAPGPDPLIPKASPFKLEPYMTLGSPDWSSCQSVQQLSPSEDASELQLDEVCSHLESKQTARFPLSTDPPLAVAPDTLRLCV